MLTAAGACVCDGEDVLGVVADAFDVLDDGHVGENGRDVRQGLANRGVDEQLATDLLDEQVDLVVGVGDHAAQFLDVVDGLERLDRELEASLIQSQHLDQLALDLLEAARGGEQCTPAHGGSSQLRTRTPTKGVTMKKPDDVDGDERAVADGRIGEPFGEPDRHVADRRDGVDQRDRAEIEQQVQER